MHLFGYIALIVIQLDSAHSTRATIEDFHTTQPGKELNNKLTFTTVATGENAIIEWLHIPDIFPEPIPKGLFDEEVTTIEGSFSNGQTEAIQSTIKWTIPETGYTCDDIDVYNWAYLSRVHASSGDSHSSASSPEAKVQLLYIPIIREESTQLEVSVHDVITLTCEACGNPPVEKYLWHSENDKNLDGRINGTTLTLNVTEEDFDDTFVCNVTNAMGSSHMSYTIKDAKSGLSVGAIVGISIASVILICVLVLAILYFLFRDRFYKDNDKHTYVREDKPPTIYYNDNISFADTNKLSENSGTRLSDSSESPYTISPYEQAPYESQIGQNSNIEPSSYEKLKTELDKNTYDTLDDAKVDPYGTNAGNSYEQLSSSELHQNLYDALSY